MSKFYQTLVERARRGEKQIAVLVDPDRTNSAGAAKLAGSAEKAGADYLFIGSSILANGTTGGCIPVLRDNCSLPCILFPGDTFQVDPSADAILFLSLISGRNPEMLIGRHVIAAPLLKSKRMEVVPTGYMLIEGGNATSAAYLSHSAPIPREKNDIAVCTAMAGEMLGLSLIYLDAGSGAAKPIPESMLREVRKNISVPLIAGGGIRTAEKASSLCCAGADLIVVGNALEKKPSLLYAMAEAVKNSRKS